MSKRKPQIILKADERSTVLQLGRERKFVQADGLSSSTLGLFQIECVKS